MRQSEAGDPLQVKSSLASLVIRVGSIIARTLSTLAPCLAICPSAWRGSQMSFASDVLNPNSFFL